MKRWTVRNKRSLLLSMALLLLLAGVPLAQLITGGTGGTGTGISSVVSTTGIQGNGLAGSPLALITPLAAALGGTGASGVGFSTVFALNAGASFGNSPNTLNEFAPIQINAPVTFSHICLNITTSDAVGFYDAGLYNSSGVLLGDWGAIHLAATGDICNTLIANASCTGAGTPAQCCTGAAAGTCPSSVTIPAGLYEIITTGTSATAKAQYNNQSIYFAANAGSFATASSTAGILPSTIITPVATTTLSVINLGFGLY